MDVRRELCSGTAVARVTSRVQSVFKFFWCTSTRMKHVYAPRTSMEAASPFVASRARDERYCITPRSERKRKNIRGNISDRALRGVWSRLEGVCGVIEIEELG